MVNFILSDVKGIKKKKIKVDESTKTGKKVVALIKSIYESQKELDILMPGIEFDRVRLCYIKYDGEKYKPDKFFKIKEISSIDNKTKEKSNNKKDILSSVVDMLVDTAFEKLGTGTAVKKEEIAKQVKTAVSKEQKPFRDKEELTLVDGVYVLKTSGGRKSKGNKKEASKHKKKKK